MMMITYKFYRKAEDKEATDMQGFEGTSEKDVQEAVHEYCDTYGYEAFTLIDIKVQPKHWETEEIKNLIQSNDTMLYRSLLKLYECQTSDEQRAGYTKLHNGVGFNSLDSKILTSFCKFLQSRGFLSDKQKAVARKKIVKYTKQITNLANLHEKEKEICEAM